MLVSHGGAKGPSINSPQVSPLRYSSDSTSFTYYSAWVLQPALQQHEHTGTVFGLNNKKQFQGLMVIEPPTNLVDCLETIVRK